MKVSFAIVALLGYSAGVSVEKRHHRHGLVQRKSYPGVTFIQSEVESDPIHGSLGPAARAPYVPNAEQKLEAHLRTLKPREFTHETETFTDTMNSLKIAEKITGNKMEEPFDVPKRIAKLQKSSPIVHYKIHDISDDEDADTKATRASLKWAEHQAQQRFFTTESDKTKYLDMLNKKQLREEVQHVHETDDHILKTQAEYDAYRAAKKDKAVDQAKSDVAQKQEKAALDAKIAGKAEPIVDESIVEKLKESLVKADAAIKADESLAKAAAPAPAAPAPAAPAPAAPAPAAPGL